MTFNIAGKTAVITGAGNGIGRALAIEIGQRGAHIALVDIDEKALQHTARLAGGAPSISLHSTDLANRAGFDDLVAAILVEHGSVDLLINNAGVAVAGDFENIPQTDFDWLFAVNFWAPVLLTRAFLPELQTRPSARIVNMSSIFGMVAPPSQSAYSASKFALTGFSQSLTHQLSGSNVGVTTVYPGGVATKIAERARIYASSEFQSATDARSEAARLLTLPAATAARLIADGIEKEQSRLLIGRDSALVSLIQRLFPSRYWRIIKRF